MAERDQQQKLLAFAREMGKAPSDAERKLWQSLRRNHLEGMSFRRQHRIGPFIVDFACNECNLVVEVDGSQHDDAVDYDERRTEYLSSLGWRVLRFPAWDVVKEHDAVLSTILFDARRPPP